MLVVVANTLVFLKVLFVFRENFSFVQFSLRLQYRLDVNSFWSEDSVSGLQLLIIYYNALKSCQILWDPHVDRWFQKYAYKKSFTYKFYQPINSYSFRKFNLLIEKFNILAILLVMMVTTNKGGLSSADVKLFISKIVV